MLDEYGYVLLGWTFVFLPAMVAQVGDYRRANRAKREGLGWAILFLWIAGALIPASFFSSSGWWIVLSVIGFIVIFVVVCWVRKTTAQCEICGNFLMRWTATVPHDPSPTKNITLFLVKCPKCEIQVESASFYSAELRYEKAATTIAEKLAEEEQIEETVKGMKALFGEDGLLAEEDYERLKQDIRKRRRWLRGFGAWHQNTK